MPSPFPHKQDVRPPAPEKCPAPDTPLEAALDDFARLAALTCGAPLGLVSLSDGTQRWFPACPGPGDAGAPPDAAFRASAPLLTPGGGLLGTLAVLGPDPRELTPPQCEALRLLARRLAAQIGIERGLAESARAVEALREGEARFRSIAAQTPGMVYRFVLRPDGSVSLPFVSEGCRDVYGLEPEDVQRDASLVTATIPAEGYGEFTASVAESARTMRPWNWRQRIVRPDGEERWVQASSRPHLLDDGAVVWDGVLTDVTDRVHAEQALDEREAHLRRSNSILQAQQEAALDGVLIVDEHSRIVSYNRRFCELWGIPASVASGSDDTPTLSHVASQVREADEFLCRVKSLYAHPEESSRDELHLKDGRVLDRYSAPARSGDGHNYGRVWYFRDVTEQKRAEEALRASEERLRTVVAGLPLILFVLDVEGVITFLDGRGLNALGLKPGEAVGRPMQDLYDGSPDVQGAIRRALAGETVSIVQESAGAVFEAQFIPQCDGAGRTGGVIGVAVDVTERRWAEQQILGLNAELEQRLDRIVVLNYELAQAYDATIEGWSRALDLRDHETEGHSLRVTEMTLRLAEAFGIADDALVHVRRGALLHDIGKMGVPDAVLLKPGPLTDDERAVMQRHPALALDMLSPVEFLRPALDIPYCHHEKWDGAGYPRGLRGEDIPFAARLFAVVDVWDALRSDRPYRRAWPVGRTRAHVASLAGTHFDPRVVDVFLTIVGDEAGA